MKMYIYKATSIIVLIFLATNFSVSAQVQNKLFRDHELFSLKKEIREGEHDKVLIRLERIARESQVNESESMKICRQFMHMQSAHEWRKYREVLNPIMAEKLAEISRGLPDSLNRSQREEATQLVMMGRLYERYLFDRNEAKNCYFKIVKGLAPGLSQEQRSVDWKVIKEDLELRAELTADEKYALKRLHILSRRDDVVANRVAAALDARILEEEQALVGERSVEEFDPGDIPFEEIAKQHGFEGGAK